MNALIDIWGTAIQEGDVLKSLAGVYFGVVKDQDFGLSLQEMQGKIIEKLTQEVASKLEVVYEDETWSLTQEGRDLFL